ERNLVRTVWCPQPSPEALLNRPGGRLPAGAPEIRGGPLRRRQPGREKRKLEWLRVRGVLDRDDIDIEFQPVFDLADCRIVSLEALARFWTEPMRSPSAWFAEAAELGLRFEFVLTETRLIPHRLN